MSRCVTSYCTMLFTGLQNLLQQTSCLPVGDDNYLLHGNRYPVATCGVQGPLLSFSSTKLRRLLLSVGAPEAHLDEPPSNTLLHHMRLFAAFKSKQVGMM